MSTSLSKNFTLEELTHTDTGASNVPNDEQRYKLLLVANYLLQPVRNQFGTPVHVTSGFRSSFVHEAIKKTQGAPTSSTSQHLLGEAVDFVPESEIEKVFEWCKENLIYGQLILESHNGKKWIHISLPRFDKPNMQVLLFQNGEYANG
jgi:hypothetical protein